MINAACVHRFVSCLFWAIAFNTSIAPMADAEIYKHIKPDGSIEYTDTPSDSAEKIKLKKIPTWHFDMPQKKAPTSDQQAEKKSPYRQILITQPADNSAFNLTSGNLAVSATLTPFLQPNHFIQWIVDGQPVANSTQLSTTLNGLYRGTHSIGARVTDNKGNILITSPTISVTIHKPSILRKK